MKIDFKKLEYYWLGFNFFARRIMGIFGLVGGVFATLWSSKILIDPAATIDVKGAPSADVGIKVIVCLASFAISMAGCFFFMMQRYFSKRIRQWMRANNKPLFNDLNLFQNAASFFGVIPVQTGIQRIRGVLDIRLRGYDELRKGKSILSRF